MVVGLVDPPVGLRRRPLPVDLDCLARDGEADPQKQRLADAVDLDLVPVGSVGQLCDRGPHRRLGAPLHRREQRRGVVEPQVVEQLEQPALRDLHRRELGVQIAENLLGQADVAEHDRGDVFVEGAGVDELARGRRSPSSNTSFVSADQIAPPTSDQCAIQPA